jgi:hypothetical protein
MDNAKRIKRADENPSDIITKRMPVVDCKDKALLCCITKKSPYKDPINNPRRIDAIITVLS